MRHPSRQGILFSISILLVHLLACVSTQEGIGQPFAYTASSRTAKSVIQLASFEEAISVAAQLMQEALPNAVVRISGNQESVVVRNFDFFLGDVVSTITPIVVKDLSSKAVGYLYRVVNRGSGANASMAPGYVGRLFLCALG